MTELEPEEFQRWSDIYYKASTSLENREKNVDDAAELIEKVSRLSKQNPQCFSRRSQGEYWGPWGHSFSVVLYISTQNGTNCKNVISLTPAGSTNLLRFQVARPDYVRDESWSSCYRRWLVSFDATLDTFSSNRKTCLNFGVFSFFFFFILFPHMLFVLCVHCRICFCWEPLLSRTSYRRLVSFFLFNVTSCWFPCLFIFLFREGVGGGKGTKTRASQITRSVIGLKTSVAALMGWSI